METLVPPNPKLLLITGSPGPQASAESHPISRGVRAELQTPDQNRTAPTSRYRRQRQAHCPHELDAAPQAGVDHRYRDLSGLRGQITGDCLHRGSAADYEDSRARPTARGRGHHAGTGAASGLTTDADSDINRMGGWPRVVFGRRPGCLQAR